MFSPKIGRKLNKNIQPGPKKQHSYLYADFDFHCLSFHLQSECLCKTFPMKIMKVTWFSCGWLYRWHYIFIPIVSHKDSFCHRGKSKLGIGPLIHELLREPLTFFVISTRSFENWVLEILSQVRLIAGNRSKHNRPKAVILLVWK